MRKDITVTAQPRATRGKNQARRLRAAGWTPAVVYGAGAPPVAVAVNPKEMNRILHSASGHNTIFNIAIDGESAVPSMIVDWQHDPVKGRLLHIDLLRIDLQKRLRVKVPVHAVGEPRGVKQQGGLLEVVAREIEVECLPEEIPEYFNLDVTELLIGRNLRASDVALSASMKLLSPPDAVIVNVIALRTSEAAATTAEEAVAVPEPEVIKKGRKEEEGQEEGKAKKK